MPPPDETRDEAIRRLQQRAGALEARTVQKQPRDLGVQAHSYGYRLLGLLLGGVAVGLGFGWAIDAVAKTTPFGIIVGVLVGFVVSVWLAVRTARQMTADASQEWGPPQDLGPDDDGDV